MQIAIPRTNMDMINRTKMMMKTRGDYGRSIINGTIHSFIPFVFLILNFKVKVKFESQVY